MLPKAAKMANQKTNILTAYASNQGDDGKKTGTLKPGNELQMSPLRM
jgi:hypothetical protein